MKRVWRWTVFGQGLIGPFRIGCCYLTASEMPAVVFYPPAPFGLFYADILGPFSYSPFQPLMVSCRCASAPSASLHIGTESRPPTRCTLTTEYENGRFLRTRASALLSAFPCFACVVDNIGRRSWWQYYIAGGIYNMKKIEKNGVGMQPIAQESWEPHPTAQESRVVQGAALQGAARRKTAPQEATVQDTTSPTATNLSSPAMCSTWRRRRRPGGLRVA